MKIGISGGTGLIGSRLTQALIERGDSVRIFSRRKNPPGSMPTAGVEFVPRSIPQGSDWVGLDGFVNLAGENIAGVRWTESSKKRFRYSRVEHTKSIADSYLTTSNEYGSLNVFLQASAIGFYGSTEERGSEFDESSSVGSGYLAELSKDWENASSGLKAAGIRVAIPRIGIVLDPQGGALGKLVPVFKSFLGGPIGKGEQGMSWIHIQDMVGILLHLLDRQDLEGVFNATAPHPLTNKMFSNVLGEVLGRPSSMWTPAFAIQLLFGEGAKVVTEGQIVYPKRTLESGYRYRFSELKPALENLLNP